jgi:Flp pilus assembly protein CpaB
MTEPIKVVVASTKIEQGKIIDVSMLEEKTVPKQYVQPKYISSIKDFYIDNKPSFISLVNFEQGEQITSTKITSISSDSGISNTIPTNQRAITLVFPREEIYGIVSPGSTIDLIAILEYEDKNNTLEETAVVIAQNLLVLAVGSNVIGGVNDLKNENITVSLPVTVSVTVKQAQEIMLTQEKGIIKVALRPSADSSIDNNISAVKINDILKDAKKTVSKNSSNDAQLLKEMQKRQKEVVDIINKYSSK